MSRETRGFGYARTASGLPVVRETSRKVKTERRPDTANEEWQMAREADRTRDERGVWS